MKYLSKEDSGRIARPDKLTSLQHKVMTWHELLNYLSFMKKFQLMTFGILPKKLLALQDSKPLCASCLFGKSYRKGWITKGYIGG